EPRSLVRTRQPPRPACPRARSTPPYFMADTRPGIGSHRPPESRRNSPASKRVVRYTMPTARTLLQKIVDLHTVTRNDDGDLLLYVDYNVVHEGPFYAFDGL